MPFVDSLIITTKVIMYTCMKAVKLIKIYLFMFEYEPSTYWIRNRQDKTYVN